MKSTPSHSFTYTDFVNQVTTDQVKTATIAATGHVSGQLKNGDDYTSQIPTAIRDDQLASDLRAHRVQVKGTPSGGTSLLSIILSFLPLLLFLGFFVWMGRRASRQLAGGIMGIGGSKAKVYELDDKPKTRFRDVAGYDGAKREVAGSGA